MPGWKTASLLIFSTVSGLYAAGSDPVRWSDGGWDDAGAPEGVLLSDNAGWWGRCVFTGVTYSYADEPTAPRDQLLGDKKSFGRRLLDGDTPTGWHKPVGIAGKKPLTVTFDFKRPCRFSEVDVLSGKTVDAAAALEVSADGKFWRSLGNFTCVSARTRMRPEHSGRGRYLRLTFKAKSSSATYLDEVLVWGEAEVSAGYPENIVPLDRGDALKMSSAADGKLRIVPLKDPTVGSEVKTGMPPMSFDEDCSSPRKIVMARNETETRYYAVVNGTGRRVKIPVSVAGFGKGVVAELRIGGLVRTQPPKYKLTEKQRFDLQLTGEEPDDAFGPSRMDVLPFFAPEVLPPANFARKHLGNPEQVSGFPDAVGIAPGEGAVLMLRVRTDGARPESRTGVISAGPCSLRVPLRVLDVTLPDAAPWVFVWGQFSRQFPFESGSRIRSEAAVLGDLGVTVVNGLPEKGSKAAFLAEECGRSRVIHRVYGLERKLIDKTYRGRSEKLTDEDRSRIDAHLAELRARAAACGVEPGRVMLEISDEPGMRNAAIFGDVCRHFRKTAPDMRIYLNPCFWEKNGFASADDILSALGGYYNGCVDVSVPYRSLTENGKLRTALWTSPRMINAQYAHPAHRAGRSIAWSGFRYGLNGFGYWSYYSPTGNPWDIRTWKYWSYECQLVFPLENGVALTPVYEEMREAYEDWLLLSLLREKGLEKELKSLLGEFAASFDKAKMETSRPYRCDFASLRLKALEYAARCP